VSGLAPNPLRVVAGHRTLGVRWSAAVLTGAVLSLAAGWIHFAFVASHWRDWWAYGAFFLATGIFQAMLAPALLRWPNMWTALTGIAGNVAIIGMYVMSRTYRIPMGPHEGTVEKATIVDLTCTAGEIVLVAVLLGMVGATNRRWILNLLLVAGAGLWILRLTNKIA
jgi:uncharacterized membrane protein HdeD (DUF308 family)